MLIFTCLQMKEIPNQIRAGDRALRDVSLSYEAVQIIV